MFWTTYLEDRQQLSLLEQTSIKEVIVSHHELSRMGELTHDEVLTLASQAKEAGFKLVLEWDILMTQDIFESAVRAFERIPNHLFSSIRVQDPGAVEYILQKTKIPIQLIVETGHHNFMALRSWEKYLGPRLERLVVSTEISKDKLIIYKNKLQTPLELLGLGRLLIFYSPRKLLSPLSSDEMTDWECNSEESPHKGFPLVENNHGTFMFYPKHHCLLDRLVDIPVDYLRVDLRNNISKEIWPLLGIQNSFEKIKMLYGKDLIRGYFQVNKSDVQFKKLKNKFRQERQDSFIAEILESSKGQHLAVVVKNGQLQKGKNYLIKTTEGKLKAIKLKTLRKTDGTSCNQIEQNELGLLDFISGVGVKSQIFEVDPTI